MVVAFVAITGFADVALADQAGDIANAQSSADTAFMLVSSALVLLMTPGLAFFMVVLCDRTIFSTH